MTVMSDIEDRKSTAVSILEGKIADAEDLRNSGKPGLDEVIADLRAKRQAVLDEALDAALSSDALAAALAVLTEATTAMSDEADKLVTAADFISKSAGLLDAANKVVTALQTPPA